MSLIISLLIALMCGFFVLRSHLVQIEELRYDRLKKLVNNSESGIQYLLSCQNGITEDEELVMDLYDEHRDSVLLRKQSWGVYDIILSKAFFQSKHSSKQALVGTVQVYETNTLGLYLADSDKPLKISGNTQLWGQTFTSEQPIKRTSIEGQNFVGENLIFGTKHRSSKTLPPISFDLISSLSKRLSGQFSLKDSLINDLAFFQDTIVNSFSDNSIVLKSANTLLLEKHLLKGNVICFSAKNIIVSATAQLDGIILFAPRIEIEEGFHGNLQAFASSDIIIQENVELTYPSSIGLIALEEGGEAVNSILVHENCKINGTLFATSLLIDEEKKLIVSTSPGFELQGELYANCMLDLKGKVIGTVYCKQLVLKTNSSVYENHLLNVIIDPTRLSQHFVRSNLFSSKRRAILRWL